MIGLGGTAPLTGVRVLEIGMNIAGPLGASILADLGADVVKLEGPGGDTARSMEPRAADGTSSMVAAMNRSKRYVGLDLASPDVAPARDALVRWADVLVQNLRPGKAEQLGVGADGCHDLNPRLVHVGVEAFYPADGARPGYDLMVQAETGMLHLTGSPDRPPSRLPGSLLDHTTGLWAALGVVAALHGARDRTTMIVTMADVAQNLLADRVAAHVLTGESPIRMESATSVVTPLGAYATADGEVVIGAASDALFLRLCAVVAPGLAEDERFRDNAGRLRHRAELDEALLEALAAHDAGTWEGRLDEAGVPVARVRDLPGAVDRHRRLSRTGLVPVEGVPDLEVVANPLGVTGPVRGPGRIGADSRAVLVDEAGLALATYERLEASGVVVD